MYFCNEIKQAYISVGSSAALTEAHVFSDDLSCIFWWCCGATRGMRAAQGGLGACQVDAAPEAQTGINCWGACNRRLRGVIETKGTAPHLGVQIWLPEVEKAPFCKHQ
jgi:hypothetical protein